MPKLIESDFPFARLSLIAERESWRKEIYRPVYYLHKWWARRLGSVFRGILLGACLEEGDDFWKHFYAANDFKDTVVFDPFMGSGVTVGEAVKIGCRVIGRDINPVAWLSCRTALSKYSVSEVFRTYGELEEKLAPRILQYYRTTADRGEDATVLYYFLVKVVTCRNCAGDIDLFKTRIFSRNAITRKDPTARSVCPGCGALNRTLFNAKKVNCPDCSTAYNPQEGNIKGPKVTCNHCGKDFKLVDRMRSLEGPLKYRRYAKMILLSDGRKTYEPLNECDREIEQQVYEEYTKILKFFPEISIEPGYNTNQMLNHNYRFWHEVLSDRQLVCAKHAMDAINGIVSEDLRLLFACLFSGVLEFNNLFTSFKGEGTGAVRHMFAHHVLKPEMMPLEANLWGTSKSSGAFSTLFQSRVKRALDYKADPFELRLNGSSSGKVRGINLPINVKVSGHYGDFNGDSGNVYLSAGDSGSIDLPDNSVDLVITDPPFFDNVHYSQLADFFYYWLNQILAVSGRDTTRSADEVQDTEPEAFTRKLTHVFGKCRSVLKPNGLFIFTYHHSRHEGWRAVHRAIRHAGFACIQTYPIKAEMSVSMPLQQAKSPIHLDLILVCKKEKIKTASEFDPYAADISKAVCTAKQQIYSLRSEGVKVSLGDAKVVIMGSLLCETHLICNLEEEESFLGEVEQDIDAYVNEVIAAQGEVLYEKATGEHVQLALFEDMSRYLSQKKYADEG